MQPYDSHQKQGEKVQLETGGAEGGFCIRRGVTWIRVGCTAVIGSRTKFSETIVNEDCQSVFQFTPTKKNRNKHPYGNINRTILDTASGVRRGRPYVRRDGKIEGRGGRGKTKGREGIIVGRV